jgi:hypothetical protein
MAAVEDGDLAQHRHMLVHAPQVIVRQFVVGRRLEAHRTQAHWTDALNKARTVPSLPAVSMP